MTYLREIILLMGNQVRRMPAMLMFFSAASLLDVVGLWLIPPYLGFALGEPGVVGDFSNLLSSFAFSNASQEMLVVGFGAALIALAVIKLFLGLIIQRVTVRFGQQQQVRLRTRLMSAYQAMPYDSFVQRNRADMILNIQVLAKSYGDFLTMILQSGSDVIVGVAILTLLAVHDPVLLASVLVINLLVFGLYDLVFRKRLRTLGMAENKAAASLIRGVNEALDGFKEIRVLGREKRFFDIAVDGASQQATSQEARQIITFMPRYLIEAVAILVIVGLTVKLTLTGEVDNDLVPNLVLLGVAGLRLLPITKGILTTLQQARYDRNSIHRLYNEFTLIEAEEIVDLPGTLSTVPDKTDGSLQLSSVTFAYGGAENRSLSGVDLEIKAGQRIGIVGPSGSGKSTLVDVLLGLLVPTKGKITLNGQDVTGELGHHLSAGYLPQDVFLVDGTLRENVALGVPARDVDDNAVTLALAKARLTAADACFPAGLETTLGERGTRLSGGQKQRVALARAFYFDRNFLVLDEATSALDDKVEAQIIDEVFALSRDITLVIVAHRLSTVKSCDWIFRMEEGQVVEEGTPDIVLRSRKGKDS